MRLLPPARVTAREETIDLLFAIQARGIDISYDDAQTLRRAAMTLHRWAEEECNGTIQRPWAEGMGTANVDPRPYRPHAGGRPIFYLIPDREAGALRRVAEVCDRLGLTYHHQQDPRGCALYVDSEPIPNNDYTRAVACAR